MPYWWLSTLAVLLADDAVTNIAGLPGGAGWVGAGLLGSVLGWMFFIHLPSKDKQLKELIDAKDAQLKDLLTDKDMQIKGIITDKDTQINVLLQNKWAVIQTLSNDHRDAVKALSGEFRAAVLEMTAHCDRELDRFARLLGTPPLREGEKS